jgi:exosome complex component RRP42
MSRSVIAEIQKEQIRKLASEGKRTDGRGFGEFRNLETEVNPIGAAEGSARIKLGNTDVLVGVKMNVGTPYPDKPNDGVLMTGNELKPMAHPDFGVGPPGPGSIEIARVVDRGIRESKMLDLSKLCIVPGEKVWMVFVDIQVIDYDGNLFDAATLGALLALHNTNVPASKFELDEDYKLPVNGWPLSVTCCKVDNFIIVDPILLEEQIAEARLTVSIDENNAIRAMQKGLSGAFTYEEVVKAVDVAASLTKELGRIIINTGE